MITTEQIARMVDDYDTTKRSNCIMQVIEALSIKPDITIDRGVLIENLKIDSYFSAWLDRGVIKYKGVPLLFNIEMGPYQFAVMFPSVTVKRRELRYGGHREISEDWREYSMSVGTKAKSTLNTDEFYEQIQKAHTRYQALLKRRCIKKVD